MTDIKKVAITEVLKAKDKRIEELSKELEKHKPVYGVWLCPLCNHGTSSGNICYKCLESKLSKAVGALEFALESGDFDWLVGNKACEEDYAKAKQALKEIKGA